jgi:arginine/serine-rich splicing factor 3
LSALLLLLLLCSFSGGLDDHVSKHEVEEFFSGQGSISNIWIAAKPPGFAFVEFGSPEAAEAAGTEHTNNTQTNSK